jgi:ABC-type multidrug transport system ATPase subunit
MYGLDRLRKGERIKEMVEVFELGPHLRSNAELLPLGFKQRLALACATLHAPAVLFLDEPTSGVDPLMRREFWHHINALTTKGVAVVVTTHFMEEAEYCDRIGLIWRGKKIAEGTPDELKSSVSSPQLPEPTLEETFIALIEGQAA